MRSASRSANGNELTLARERQAKQSCAFLWSPAFVPWPGSGCWHSSRLAYDDLIYDHRNDEGRTDDDRIDELSDRRRSRRPKPPLRHRCRRAGAATPPSPLKLRDRNRTFVRTLIRTPIRTLIRTPIRILIPGASRLPLASNAIARGASPGLRAIHHCSCLLMRPRAGPDLRRQVDRRQLRRRQREPSKTSHSAQNQNRRQPAS